MLLNSTRKTVKAVNTFLFLEKGSKKGSQVAQQEIKERNVDDKKSQASQHSNKSGAKPSNQSVKGSSSSS